MPTRRCPSTAHSREQGRARYRAPPERSHMDGLRFDNFTKSLGAATSRRRALKVLAGAGAGSVMALVGADRAGAIAPGRCRNAGTVCRQDIECCSGFCDPTTLLCACAPGSNVFPSTGACVPACASNEVFNAQTCRCECPGQRCNGVCCTSGQVCSAPFAGCCTNPTLCTSTNDCCPGFFCRNPSKGSGVCTACASLMCQTSANCCEGFVCVKGA